MIKINRVHIKNFRQYRSVELVPSSDKGIFLFIGKNGMGKSNFLNAICWCLYEDLPFKSHDEQQSTLNIFNEEALLESKSIVAEVEIDVVIENTEYKFQRRLTNLPIGNTNSDFRAFRKDKSGWIEIPNATHYIDNFLPRSLRQFFLFDGEGVRNLFKGAYSSSLKESIWKVSHIDLLNTSIEHLKSVAGELRKTLSREMPELESSAKAIEEYEKLIAEKQKEKDGVSEQRLELDRNLHRIAQKYRDSTKYRGLQDKRDNLLKQKNFVTSKIIDTEREISGLFVATGPSAFLLKELSEYTIQISTQRDKGKIPAAIKPTLISDLLETQTCICGRHIDDIEIKYLKNLMEKNEEADSKEFLVNDGYILGTLNQTLKVNYTQIIDSKKSLRLLEQENETIERQLKEISDNLIGAPESEIGDIETSMRMMQDESSRVVLKIDQLSREIIDLEQRNKDERQKLQKLAATESRLKVDMKKMELLEATIECALKIRDSVIDQVRKNVSLNTNKYFHELMWKDDFSKVEFTDDYKIQIQKHGLTELIDHTRLSNGEIKVLGFATIKALTELSGFENFPAFIDAPVEQLDQEVEKNLLELLPDFMPQKQVFVFSLDGENIVNFGNLRVDKDKFFKLSRANKSLNTQIESYHAN